MTSFLDINVPVGLLGFAKKISLVFPDYYEVDKNGKILRQIRRHDFKKVKIFEICQS